MTKLHELVVSLVPIANVAGAVLLAWIALKQAQLNKVITVLEKNTNSIKDALIVSTAKASHAEGVLQGKLEQKSESIQKP